jgi:hypothetical protein
MKSFGRKNTGLILIATLILMVVVFYGGRYFLFTKIRTKIEEQLAHLKDKGIDIQYDYMETGIFTGKIEFYQLSAKLRSDSITSVSCLVPHFLVKGIQLLPFLQDRSLVIDYVTLQEARITYTPGSKFVDRDSTETKKLLLQSIDIGTIIMPSLKFILTDSTASDTVMRLSCNLDIHSMGIRRQTDSLTWRKGQIKINTLNIDHPKSYYGAHIKNVNVDLVGKTLTVDSILIKPSLGRRKFMQVHGKEIDYISGIVPYVKLTDINWLNYPTDKVEIGKVLLQLNLEVFRDKRYPFIKHHTTTLPSHYLQQLPFQVSIDSILLTDSYVSYEEFPDDGDSTGIVVFDKLYATITQVHNNPQYQSPTIMKAHSKFMSAGDLNVNFSFPYNTSAPYYVSGHLTNMPLNRMNSMLGAAAKVKIERGTMTDLKFDFSYTLTKSTGKVELNYEDLKILSLRENKEQKQAISMIKTLLLNAFIIRKDMNEDVERDKRTGTIEFYRDQKRSIFNYWWKSVFSGIKSAYRIDKLPIRKKGASDQPEKHKKKDRKSKTS